MCTSSEMISRSSFSIVTSKSLSVKQTKLCRKSSSGATLTQILKNFSRRKDFKINFSLRAIKITELCMDLLQIHFVLRQPSPPSPQYIAHPPIKNQSLMVSFWNIYIESNHVSSEYFVLHFKNLGHFIKKNKVKRLANGKYWIYYNTALPSK